MDKIINKISKKKSILVVPLDWGLGHATRCIPLIRELQANECEVIIAAETAIKSLLEFEFQQLTIIPIEGYRINYSRNSSRLPLKIISQIPGILYNIYKEHNWLKKVVKKFAITGVISDNRFGLYHSGIPTVYITHQLLIKTGNVFSENIAQKIHFFFLKKYNSCWIPDFEGKDNIAGELSHPVNLPPNLKYIGCLSRFEKKDTAEKKYDLLVIITGPEPQRTIFEDLLLPQLQNYKGNALLVRGLPGLVEKAGNEWYKNVPGNGLVVRNHLSSAQLNDAIQQSTLVICRSGYTTVMDLIKLSQKAILVPTPGQTEQEYLAAHLMKNHFFYATMQEGFTLEQALKEAADFRFEIPSFDMDQYKKVVYQFVQSL